MTVLFDLDGTLTDSCAGICRCINHALETLGAAAAPEPDLRAMVGAPLGGIFARLLGSDDPALLDRAIDAYRDRFDAVGIFENGVYPGVPEALTAIRAAGHRLHVVTVKPTAAATRVLAHFGLAPFFASVHGAAPADRACDKALLVQAALEADGAAPALTVMVGDRAEDIRAARAHGVRAVAAAWGYGSPAEIRQAGPDWIAESALEFARWVLQGRAAPHAQDSGSWP